MSTITCCKGCEARTPYCHSMCERYITERSEWMKLKEAHDKRRRIEMSLEDEKGKKVYRADKRRRNKRKAW